MSAAPRQALLTWIVGLAAVPMAALAQDHAPIDRPFEAVLDMDEDGRMDRAVLSRHPDGGLADLSIYLAAGDGALDPSRKPTFLKPNLTAEGILYLEGRDAALVFTYGCGGCSNDYETTLTIIYRGGDFLVAGYTYAWDTRAGIGSCDIDFLAGKGVMTHGLDGAAAAIPGDFRPVRLADWTDDKRPAACDI